MTTLNVKKSFVKISFYENNETFKQCCTHVVPGIS